MSPGLANVAINSQLVFPTSRRKVGWLSFFDAAWT